MSDKELRSVEERLRIVKERLDDLLDDGVVQVTLTRREISVILDQLDARTNRLYRLEDLVREAIKFVGWGVCSEELKRRLEEEITHE